MIPLIRKTAMAVDEQIKFVLDHPEMSDWLKITLRGALDLDPISILSDIQILDNIFRQRLQYLIEDRHRSDDST